MPADRGTARRDATLLVAGAVVVAVVASQSGRRRSPPAPRVTPASVAVRRSLEPVPNPDPAAPAQPRRLRPYRVAVTADGATAYVTLAGTEARPGEEVAVLDVRDHRERRRIRVGRMPYGIALDPSGRWLLVTNRLSNFISVIEVATDEVVAEISVPFYCDDLVIAPDGARAYLSNFWKGQVIVVDLDGPRGAVHDLGLDRVAFERPGGPGEVLRGRCGTRACHLASVGGFVAGADPDAAFAAASAHVVPGAPDASWLLLATTPERAGGRADGTDGYHHPGGAVFVDPAHDPDVAVLRAWITAGQPGPGISVGAQPRDLALSSDGRTLYVANTGSLDVAVVDVSTLRERGRIAARAPVSDVVEIDGWLVLTALGVGSGHPKAHDAARESLDPGEPGADLTILRDPTTGRPLPLDQQRPAGPFADVDGTAQEKFRDVSNDVVVLDPAATTAVDRYAATAGFTRYTSDTFEATAGDARGDVAPELLAVVGALPEQAARDGDRIYVTMAGTFQVQEWVVDVAAAAPARRLTAGRVFGTGLGPGGIARAGRTLVVADHLGDSVSFVDLDDGGTDTVTLATSSPPYPATDFERGELIGRSALWSSDQDATCVHCHYRDSSDGKAWSVGSVTAQSHDRLERTGGSREVPDLRDLFAETPLLVEGVLALAEPLGPITDQAPLEDFAAPTPAGDFTGIFALPEEAVALARSAHATWQVSGRPWDATSPTAADLVKRRDTMFAQTSRRWLGAPYGLREVQRLVGLWQGGEGRLLPDPEDATDPMVARGRALFESPAVGCAGCHPAPTFTDKVHPPNENRAFPPLVTLGRRDAIHNVPSPSRIDANAGYVRAWDPDDRGRVQQRADQFVAPSLRGLWARPPRLLHDGRARSLREVLATPAHPALRPGEVGRNERDGVPDTHGATSHLNVWELECLRRYVLSIE